VDVIAWYADVPADGDGPAERREGWRALVASRERAGAGGVVVAPRDRLSTDVVAEAMAERALERRGAHLVSADGDADVPSRARRLRASILAAFARHRAEESATDATLARILDLLRAGESLPAIATVLDREGFRAPGEGAWTPEAVEAALTAAAAPILR
jgi:hypothetical protein